MKFTLVLGTLFISTLAFGQAVQLKDYDWTATDIASKGLTKENLFDRMDTKFIRPGKSICSNRAHMWANDFKRLQGLDTAKIFLFYTKKKDEGISLRTWWYHVAPAVNEKGNFWVMDAGFPGFIDGPMKKEDWMHRFIGSRNCKEIDASETELVELIFRGQTFPHRTSYGHYDCYYKITPHTIWTPNVLAENLLGKDAEGNPVRTERPEIDKNELYQACVEATSSNLGWVFGSSKEKCKKYIRL